MKLKDGNIIIFHSTHSMFRHKYGYSLANGASEILAEEDPNMARIYICAKDANGQMFVQGFDLSPVEEPKPITMDDINSKMNRILERLDKLEVEQNDQSVRNAAWKGGKQSGNTGYQSNGRNGSGGAESSSVGKTVSSK